MTKHRYEVLPDQNRINVLDHGFVELIEVMGSDKTIEQAARVSYTGGEKEEKRTLEQTTKLLRHLMRHKHTTPFEQAVMRFRIALPIFDERQMARHRTASWNELSSRYSEMPDLFYVPHKDRIKFQAEGNKQGSGEMMQGEYSDAAIEGFKDEQVGARTAYKSRLDAGMAKELARINLPLSQYTVKVWKMDLHNLCHFMLLRLDEHAQEEIRVYAEAIAAFVQIHFPITWDAFFDYKLEAVTFSRMERVVLGRLLRGEDPNFENLNLTDREVDEFTAKVEGLHEEVA